MTEFRVDPAVQAPIDFLAEQASDGGLSADDGPSMRRAEAAPEKSGAVRREIAGRRLSDRSQSHQDECVCL